ncbi:MAG: peptidase domain protein [Gemmatimonadetes bacterium]|nr:peptidase domain protein [Gemmatimonadota bacterium]
MSVSSLLRAALLACAIVAPVRAHAQADTATSTFDVNGLKVILRRNTANDVVSANVYLLGGTQQLTPATQGIEWLLLHVSERGTKRFPREKVRQLMSQLGTDVVIAPSEDWTLFGVTTIKTVFDSTFAIFADRLMAPTLDSNEVELVRARMIANVREAENNPDPLVNRLADSLAYVGHPYGFSPTGTESSLQSITLDALRNYETSQMVTSRMLLVVVGNIDRAHLEPLVQRTLAQLPRGNYTWSPPRPPAKLGRALVVREAALPTNYLLGYFAGPAARDPDYQALRVASAVLSGRFFTEIRSRRNLSYEVDAPFVERAISNGGVYVTTTDPNTTLGLMRVEIDRLQRELIDPQGLERLIGQFITDYFLKNETNADQATALARAQIYQGDYRLAGKFVEDLRRVHPEDVRRVARQYIHDFRFVYLGKSDALSRSLIGQF